MDRLIERKTDRWLGQWVDGYNYYGIYDDFFKGPSNPIKGLMIKMKA